ncbi:hypothetical protein ACVWZ4_005212 [Bradyrhizobium sp. USDA 4472]
MKRLQLIQIVAINARTLAELGFLPGAGRTLTRVRSRQDTKKGGFRIAEAAFEAGKAGVLLCFRFTAR